MEGETSGFHLGLVGRTGSDRYCVAAVLQFHPDRHVGMQIPVRAERSKEDAGHMASVALSRKSRAFLFSDRIWSTAGKRRAARFRVKSEPSRRAGLLTSVLYINNAVAQYDRHL